MVEFTLASVSFSLSSRMRITRKKSLWKRNIFKMNYGYPKIELWISLNQIIMDIQKKNHGYPKIELWISLIQAYFWIS